MLWPKGVKGHRTQSLLSLKLDIDLGFVCLSQSFSRIVWMTSDTSGKHPCQSPKPFVVTSWTDETAKTPMPFFCNSLFFPMHTSHFPLPYKITTFTEVPLYVSCLPLLLFSYSPVLSAIFCQTFTSVQLTFILLLSPLQGWFLYVQAL